MSTQLTAAYQLHFYICFRTSLRHNLFSDDRIEQALICSLRRTCEFEGYHILDVQVSEDSIRVMLSLKPEHTVSRAIQMLKGRSSYELSSVGESELARPKNEALWARGYFAASSGKVDLEKARQYVDSQVSHHGYLGEWTKRLSYRNPCFVSPAFKPAHATCILDYHVVLTTAGRAPVFDDEIASNLFRQIIGMGKEGGFSLDRMSVLPDHVHLLLEGKPSVSVGLIASEIQDKTRSWMHERYWGVLKQTGAWDVWVPSFYAGTVGHYTTAQVRRFLARSSGSVRSGSG